MTLRDHRVAIVVAALLLAGPCAANGVAQEKPPAATIVVPEDYPLIEATELKLTLLEAPRLPAVLDGAMIYVNEKNASIPAGQIEFSVKREGVILLLASWQYDGNDGGDWRPQALTREQLAETWHDLGRAPWDDTQVLFARDCKEGETFKIRTRKYNPPQPILIPKSRTIAPDGDASKWKETLLAGLTIPASRPLVEPTDTAAQIPEGYAVLDVEDVPLSPLVGDNVPSYLRGAMIFQRDQSQINGNESLGRVKFTVRRGGLVYLLATWEYDGNSRGDWVDSALDYRELTSDWAPLGRCAWDPGYWLFVRECESGEDFSLRTRKYHAPAPIVTPPIDPLDARYADAVPAELHEILLKGKVAKLFAQRDYAELERMAAAYRDPESTLPSGASPLSVLYRGLIRLSVQDQEHIESRIADLEAWQSASPDSMTPKIALAKLHINYAFLSRYGGLSNSASHGQTDVFEEQLERAEQVLLSIKDEAPQDACYYAARIAIAKGTGGDREDVFVWALRAVELAPWNEETVFAATSFLLSNWDEDSPHLVELAELLAAATSERCGEALYATTVLGVADRAGVRTLADDKFSWERIRRGLADLRARFPKSRVLLNSECALASQAFDRELAEARFNEIGDNPYLGLWGRLEDYELQRQIFTNETMEGDQDRLWLAHASAVNRARFSPDGTKILTSGNDFLVKLWDLDSQSEIRRKLEWGFPTRIAFRDDETIVLGTRSGQIQLWRWDEDELELVTEMQQPVSSLCCSPNGRYLFASDERGDSVITDMRNAEVIHRGEQEHGNFSVGTFSADSRFLATTGDDGRVQIYDLKARRVESTLAPDETHKDAIAFSPDGSQLATGDVTGIVNVWQIEGWKLVSATLEGEGRVRSTEQKDRVRSLAFSKDGGQLAIARGGGMNYETGGLWLMTVDDQAIERPVKGHRTSVHAIDLSRSGNLLLSAGEDWTLRLYDMAKLTSP